MPVNADALLPVPLGLITSFLFVLARVGGALAFIPIPGFRTAPMIPKVVLAVALAVVLLPSWPVVRDPASAPPLSLWWLPAEVAFGIAIGAFVGWVTESLIMAMQFLSLQAGYSYAAMIDPATQADSGVLQVFAQLFASVLFFVVGVDRELLRLFGASLEVLPPGAWRFHPEMGVELIRWSGTMLTLALRIALPLIALLTLIDVALALVGRLQPQLQLLSLAFPLKMLTSMALIIVLAGSFGTLFQSAAGSLMKTLWRVTGLR